MKSLRPGLFGIVAALLSITLVLGGLSLALTEGGLTELSFRPTLLPATPTPYIPPTTLPGTPSPTPLPSTPTPTITSTAIPTDSCQQRPKSWVRYDIQNGDTLEALASLYAIPVEQLIKANCMVTSTLLAGTYIYVPPAIPSPTATVTNSLTPTVTQLVQVFTLSMTPFTISCGPPPAWVLYTVQKEDTLYKLSQVFGVSVYQLQLANCLGNSSVIRLGAQIYVPFLPPSSTPEPTTTRTSKPPSSATPMPTNTQTPTLTPTPTNTQTSTNTQTPSLTSTPTTTTQMTDTPTVTEIPPITDTPTVTVTPTGTQNAPP